MGSAEQNQSVTVSKRPVLVSATVTSVHLYSAFEDLAQRRSMRFGLMGYRDQIELSTGEVFGSVMRNMLERSRQELKAELHAYERRNEEELGFLYYLSAFKTDDGHEPSSLDFQVAITSEGFNTLWQLGLQRMAPTRLSFGIEGMSYTGIPDGRAKHWDIDAEGKRLEIAEFTWQLDVDDVLNKR
jgi:hypothetical protein